MVCVNPDVCDPVMTHKMRFYCIFTPSKKRESHLLIKIQHSGRCLWRSVQTQRETFHMRATRSAGRYSLFYWQICFSLPFLRHELIDNKRQHAGDSSTLKTQREHSAQHVDKHWHFSSDPPEKTKTSISEVVLRLNHRMRRWWSWRRVDWATVRFSYN